MGPELTDITQRIFSLQPSDEAAFGELALELFHYQFQGVPVFRTFCEYLNRTPSNTVRWQEVPCLPTEAFKHHAVHDGSGNSPLLFTSSSTTSQVPSVHHVQDPELYHHSFLKGFSLEFPGWEDAFFYALLPGYLERSSSSLVYMCRHLIEGCKGGGFFLNQYEELHARLYAHEASGEPYFLLGVTYALLDFCKAFPLQVKSGRIIETGGMKGKRKEMCKEELHECLRNGFGSEHIFGEYGMTELLSQAWANHNMRYQPAPWMRVISKQSSDPMEPAGMGVSGLLQVIDLANVHSCSFIATGDLGRCYEDGTFEVLGRFDLAEARGCNLMMDL
jgi:hypothetical protein